MKEITIEKEKVAIYSEEDWELLEKLLSDIPNIKGLTPSAHINKADSTTAYYLSFKLDGLWFKVRMFGLNYGASLKRTVFDSPIPYDDDSGIYLDYRRSGQSQWRICTAIGLYNPFEVIDLINKIVYYAAKYRSKTSIREMKQFFQDNQEEYVHKYQEYEDRTWFDEKIPWCDGVGALTCDYMTEKKVEDDAIILFFIFAEIFDKMLDDYI